MTYNICNYYEEDTVKHGVSLLASFSGISRFVSQHKSCAAIVCIKIDVKETFPH